MNKTITGIRALANTLDKDDIATLRELPSLNEVFLNHLPTKQGHNYNPLFERHFSSVRHRVKRVLEIGVEAGTSLRMWKEYFPNAEIVGFDINPRCKEHEEERISVVIGDQTNKADLENIPGSFDIIIDDGLHSPESQILGFEVLFTQKLAQSGIYVIEDVITSYATNQYFQKLFKFVNFWPMDLPGSKWSTFDDQSLFNEALKHFSKKEQYWILNVLGLSIYRHIIFVDKGLDPIDGQAAFRLEKPEVWEAVTQERCAWLDK